MNMYDRHNITKFLKLIFSACFILVLSACSSSDDTDTTAETVTEIPQFILKLALNTTDPNASLLAWIIIDSGEPIPMDLAGGTASASIPGLSRSVHTVEIKFEFTDDTDTVTLATATKEVDLSAGNAALTFLDADYTTSDPNTDTYDKDGDGFTNLDEIRNGTNPLVPDNEVLTSLIVEPVSKSITLGQTQSLTATATYEDTSTAIVTTSVTWSSSDDTVASVSTNGIVTSVAVGSATITASFSGQTASSVITVGDIVISDCVLDISKIGECKI